MMTRSSRREETNQKPPDAQLEQAASTMVPASPQTGVARNAESDAASPGVMRDFKTVRAEIEDAPLSPGIRGEVRPAVDAHSPSVVPESKRLRDIGGLTICALRVVGGSLDNDETPYNEPDVPRGASTQELDDEEEYEVPTLVAQVPSKPVYGARSG